MAHTTKVLQAISMQSGACVDDLSAYCLGDTGGSESGALAEVQEHDPSNTKN